MFIYMSLNSYILAYIRRIPTISTNGSKPYGRRLVCKRQGRGYAHVKHFHEYVVQLLEGGYQVVIVDDLSNSSAVAVDRVKTIVGEEAAKNLTFYEANVLDREAMNKIFDTHQIDRVIHFAGFKAVGESKTPWCSSTSCATMAASPSSSRAPRPSTATRTTRPSPRKTPRSPQPTPIAGPSG